MKHEKPDILLIILDDLNAWIGALGRHPQSQTPNIDALAQRGVLFENAYCSAPYCNASRMGIFTGRLPAKLAIYHNEPFWDRSDRPATFIELLRRHGYGTVGAGKVFHGTFEYGTASRGETASAAWREQHNRPELWDAYHTSLADPLPDPRPLNGLFEPGAATPPKYELFDWGPIPPPREHELPDEGVVAAIEAMLRLPADRPRFCAAGIYKPHLPWHAPQRFFDMHTLDDIVVPLVKDDDLDDVPPIGRKWALNPPDHELVTRHGQWKHAVRSYLACISYADHLVGRVLTALEASGRADRTAIVLCGDNGFHLGEKLHWRKFALWEEATRVPLIYVPPNGRSAGVRIKEPVSLLDIYPTLMAAAGIETEGMLDGVDLAPLVASGGDARRDRPVIMTWGRGNHSVRSARWRYTQYSDGGRELYDHSVDPLEWTNLESQPDYAEVCGQMSASIRSQCTDG